MYELNFPLWQKIIVYLFINSGSSGLIHRPSNISKKLKVSASAIYLNLDALERKNYIVSKKTGRRKIIQLSGVGRSIAYFLYKSFGVI